MTDPKFQVFKDVAKDFRFRLRSKGNGEIILQSTEGYESKQGCLKGIASVKANSPIDDRYKRLNSSSGDYYFRLDAANGEPLGRSEMYTTSQARENGVAAVKRDAPDAPIEDLT